MESPEWSQRELRVYKDLAEEIRGHDHHDHEAKFTKTSSMHTSFSLYHTGLKSYSGHPGCLVAGISSTSIQSSTLVYLGYPFYPDSGTNFFQTTLEMSQPSSFPVSVIIVN